MTKPTLLLGFSFLTFHTALSGQDLDKAEVRVPYGELKLLLARSEPAAKPEAPKPALLSARLRLQMENGVPVIDASFRVTAFSNDTSFVPLISGQLALETQEPEDSAIVSNQDSLCLALDRPGIQALRLRLLPIITSQGFTITLPPCPSAIFETGELPADQSIILRSGESDEALAGGQVRPLASSGQSLTIRLLDPQESREALRPPEPSTWTWQHQALVKPADDGLIYQIISRASASAGSGVEATLPLPPDAQDIMVSGEDLISQSKVRGEKRSLGVFIVWKTRGILDRQIMLRYRMPLRPLDRTWQLQSPGGTGTRTRFIIATSPLLAYSAKGLSDPLTPIGLPSALAEPLRGTTCQHLEAETIADLTVTSIPVAPIANGVVKEAEWTLKIEQDGAMLLSGLMLIEHKSQLDLLFDTPEGMKLLSCESGGRTVPPVDLGEGNLKVVLPAQSEKSLLTCSFTGSTAALDPVEGTMKLTLPKVPLFIHSLLWHLDMPSGYQSETHGNLKRAPVTTSGPPSRISLKKNLCRDERPEVNVFYQRSDLNR